MINRKLDELVICTFKNIADFDFTPELGAMFGGRPYFVKQGEEILLPEPAAFRMAVNLAKAILVKAVPAPEYGKGDDRSTIGQFNEDNVMKIVDSIIVTTNREEKKPTLTEEDRIAAKIEELNKFKQEIMAEVNAKLAKEAGYKDKAEVITELEKRQITFDRRKSKAELEKLLEE